MDKIYVIGDSHSVFWSGNDKISDATPLVRGIKSLDNNDFFKIFYLGSCLAYSMNNENSSTQGLNKVKFLIDNNYIPINSYIMTVFGEIDLRVHICKNINLMFIKIKNAINNYFEFINYLLYSGFKVIVCGPIPSQKASWYNNPNYPRNGTEFQRNTATLIFNTLLEIECKKLNITFFTLFNEVIDSNFETISDYIVDQCHLSRTIYNKACKLLFHTLRERERERERENASSAKSE